MTGNRCEMCVNYMYDEDYECYSCLVSLDEDEMYRVLSGRCCAPSDLTLFSNEFIRDAALASFFSAYIFFAGDK